MAVKLQITDTCYHCHGTGTIPVYTSPEGQPGSSTCFVCGGTGITVEQEVEVTELITKLDDIMDRCNDIFDKCNDIFEEVRGGH